MIQKGNLELYIASEIFFIEFHQSHQPLAQI
jgi:hypothetical protein